MLITIITFLRAFYNPELKGEIMDNKMDFGRRINRWLGEESGEVFKQGKWKFWFPLVVGLTLLNGALTAAVFSGSGGAHVWIGIIVATVGALLCWLALGNLHYSDSEDAGLARGVSLLDSATLVFVVAHFCFLLWAYGHLITLRAIDAKYDLELKAYNEKAEKLSDNDVLIAASAATIAQEQTRRARIENDTVYHARKAVQSGAKVDIRRGDSKVGAGLATSNAALKEPEKRKESASGFLIRWDWWIRLTNFGELILAVVTLIYIRNRSARFNAQSGPRRANGMSQAVATAVARMPTPAAALSLPDRQIAAAVATDERQDGLTQLREHLHVIASYYPGRWFKADLIERGVVIRLCQRRRGREVAVAQAKLSNRPLETVNQPGFQDRLRRELIARGFPIGGE